jgi:uncharacterized membrane protein
MDQPDAEFESRHIEQSARVLAELRSERFRGAPHSQRGIERLVEFVGRPWLAYGAVSFIVAWIASDVVYGRITGQGFDPARFPWLQLFASLLSLTMTILILIAENHQGRVAERRAQVTLQIALVSEEKIAKVIEMLDLLRRDDPNLPFRSDAEATRMSEATGLRGALDDMDRARKDLYVGPAAAQP